MLFKTKTEEKYKVLNQDVFIVARADEETAIEKIKRAGADRVINPYSIGGERMAHLMINPHVVDFIETGFNVGNSKFKIENIKLPKKCSWNGKKLVDLDLRNKYGVSVLTIVRDGEPMSNPSGDFKIKKGDQLIIMGDEEETDNLINNVIKDS